MADYPSNSDKSKAVDEKPVEKRVEAIVDTPVKTRKRNCLQRAMGELVREDIPKAIKDRVIPTLKDAAFSVITDTIAAVLHVDSVRPHNVSGGPRVSYRDYYNAPNKPAQTNAPRYATPGYDFDDVIFENRGVAEDVLDQMYGVLERYGMVRVADLYGLCDISCRYTDNAYGWTDLRSAKVVPVNGGWIIDFPKAISLK